MLFKKGTTSNMFITMRLRVMQLIHHSRCCWSVQKFGCSFVEMMGGVWLINIYWSFRSAEFLICRSRKLLKTRKECAKTASNQSDRDLKSAGLKWELLDVNKCEKSRRPVLSMKIVLEIAKKQVKIPGKEVLFRYCDSGSSNGEAVGLYLVYRDWLEDIQKDTVKCMMYFRGAKV